MIKDIGAFFTEHRAFYALYLLMITIFLFTFYLYDLNLTPFWDGIFFTAFLVIIYTVIAGWMYLVKQKQLREIKGKAYLSFLPAATNYTEKRYQNLLLEQAKEQTLLEEQINEKQRELLDDFGLWLHQIKTPLAALDLLVQSGTSTPTQMNNELFKINAYLQMMLNYLRQQLSNQDFVFAPIKIESLVKTALKKYATFFSQKGLQLKLGDLNQTVTTDDKWLTFIVDQLLSNALKYTFDGSIYIYTTSKQLVIEDSGIGIREDDLPRIFEKGYTGYNGRIDLRASGLGLYMAKQTAEKLGFKLTIQSKIGVGTRVVVSFPEEIEGV